MNGPELREIEEAARRVAAHVTQTPIATSRTLDHASGAELHLKCEHFQRTGSFKVRGALNRILGLSPEERARGVVAASAGNHAQGVAYACSVAGVRSTVVMPETAAIAKIDATRGYGADVRLFGADFADAFREATRIGAETGAVFVHAFDDRAVIAGQGTIALELLEQVPGLEVVVVPVGGGGLLAGITTVLRARAPGVRIVGVQPATASTLLPSLEAGSRVTRSPSLTLADGLATSGVGEIAWEILAGGVDRAVTVGEGEIAAALLLLAERVKMIVEGAAATAVAACIGPLRDEIRGRKVAIVLSGGNIDVNLLDRILNLGLAEQGRVFRFATVLPDRPGALSRLAAVLGSLRANIRTIRHDRGRVGLGVLETLVTIDLETRGPNHVAEIVARLAAEGYRIVEDERT